MRIAIVLLLLTLAACSSQPKENVTGDVIQDTSKEKTSETTTMDSISSILAAGKSMQCTATAAEFAEKVYINGQDMRTDITVTGENIEAHSIKVGDWFYTWSDAAPQGQKFKYTEMEKPNFEPKTESKQTEKVEFKCKPWSADRSKFDAPGNIEFMDVTDMMKQATQMPKVAEPGTEMSKEDICNYCNMAPEGQARDECLEQQGCG